MHPIRTFVRVRAWLRPVAFVLGDRSLQLLFPELYPWEGTGVQVLPDSDHEAAQYGEPSPPQPVLVHAVPETNTFGAQLVRQFGMSVGRNALCLFPIGELHWSDSKQLHPLADRNDPQGNREDWTQHQTSFDPDVFGLLQSPAHSLQEKN